MNSIVSFPNDPRYLVGTAFFVVAWLVVYLVAGKSRHAMHWASLAFLPTAPFFESLNQDYWHPQFFIDIHPWRFRFGMESLLLAFTFAGLSAAAYDVIHRRLGYRELTGITRWSIGRLLIAGAIAVVAISAVDFGFHWYSVWAHKKTLVANSVQAQIVALPLMWAIFLGFRKGWFMSSILTGLAMMLVMVAFYFAWFLAFYPHIIREWWFEWLTWGYPRDHFPFYWGSVPLEEFLWAATTALYLGPAVRFCMDLSWEGDWPCPEHHSRVC